MISQRKIVLLLSISFWLTGFACYIMHYDIAGHIMNLLVLCYVIPGYFGVYNDKAVTERKNVTKHAPYMVELTGLGTYEGIRTVLIPYDTEDSIRAILHAVYYYGQNEIQPQSIQRSVSIGDVIYISKWRYMVCSAGFRDVTYEPLPKDMMLRRKLKPTHI